DSPGFVGKFRRVNSNHFTAIIYRDGTKVSQCGIRLGGLLGSNQIAYSTDPSSTNSLNEALSVEDDGQEMFLKPSGMSSMFSGRSKGRLIPQAAAEMLWDLLTEHLQR